MTIKDNGKEFYFERLANGLLRTYDYKSAWDITFKKVDGKWEGHFRGDYPGYAGLLKKLNLLQQQVDAGEPFKMMHDTIVNLREFVEKNELDNL